MRLGISVLAVSIALTSPAYGQSAADKATARELAAAGIKKLGEGDAESALKSLAKAQALYDAPIHLLYLGRAHTQLGNLVEAAEAYRSLARARLDANAPPVFHQAQKDGAVELEKLEPRLARLTIEVTPEVEGLQVTVDGKPINTAVLSVPRASNPGTRTIVAEAPGYVSTETQVELSEGGEETVQLTLEPGEGEAVVAAGSSDGKEEDSASGEPSGFETGPMGIIVGLRIGGMLPVGDLETGTPLSDFLQPGVAGRAELGFRFLHHFGIKGYYGIGALSPGAALNDFAESQDETIVTKNSAGVQEAGVALLATMDPRIVGGFGELGFSALHQYKWSQKLSASDLDCENSATYSGFAVRAGGGMNIPVNPYLTLVPTVDVSIGQLGKRDASYECPSGTDPVENPLEIGDPPDVGGSTLDKSLHYQIFLGIGGDFHFGDDWFR